MSTCLFYLAMAVLAATVFSFLVMFVSAAITVMRKKD